MTFNPDLLAAAKTWDRADEPLDHTNARIHDGVPLHQLDDRADGYTSWILDCFPLGLPSGAEIMEIGSGTGYIMEAVNRALTTRGTPPSGITGLDIAKNMLDKARLRIANRGPFRFQLYDGATVPLPDASFDLIYSVATLQHIPKPFVYRLFLETKRLLKPGGCGVFHLPPFSNLAARHKAGQPFPWSEEIRQQISGEDGHWHHFYCREELDAVLRFGTGFTRVDFNENNEIWVCAGMAD